MQKKEKALVIFETYKNLMFYVANNILQDEKLSEDCVQETFIKIFKNLHKINKINCHKTKSFIVIMCKRTAIDFYRENKKLDICSFDVLKHELSVDFRTSKGEDNVIKAIQSLQYIYSEVLKLKYINEFSNKEIAEVLDISENLVRKRIERAKTKLKEKLIERGIL